jgi:pimeloyl-ACP methyl ester carboxylesterase
MLESKAAQISISVDDRINKFPLQSVKTCGKVFTFRDVSEKSKAPIIVLLHGIGSSSASWINQFENLAGQYRLIAWDAPGYSGSTALTMSSPNALDYATALHTFISAMGVSKCHLVGHSLGAIIAASFVARSGQFIDGLLLANPARGYAHKNETVKQTVLKQRIDTLNTLGVAQMAFERSAKLLSKNATKSDVALVHYSMSRLNPAGYLQAVKFLVASDLLAEVGSYDGPCEIVCGAEDQITPPAVAKEIALSYPQSHYQEIPEAGHASYIERPTLFNNALSAFVSSSSS